MTETLLMKSGKLANFLLDRQLKKINCQVLLVTGKSRTCTWSLTLIRRIPSAPLKAQETPAYFVR